MDSAQSAILVTGGAGFIGSNFVSSMVENGHKVVVLDLLTYAGHLANLEKISGPGSFEFVRGDICDPQIVGELLQRFKFNWVVNFAAESHVDRSISGPAPFVMTNVVGVFNLLHLTHQYWLGCDERAKAQFRFLHVSTDEVFGELGDSGYFSEQSAYSPNSPYSASKAGGDMLVRAWHHTYGLPTLTTNCSNNYGPFQFPEKLIPFMVRSALAGRPLGIYGNGKNVRDWIHVEDHCEGILRALRQGKPGESYCFGGRSERNNIEVVEQICQIMDELAPSASGRSYKELITFVTDRKGHDFRYAIDDSKAERDLGFKRKHTFESGLRATISWYLANQDWMAQVARESEAKA